ncbi:unnamed protein product [Rotaria socialis]|uniref:Globin-sensor domain-containing protein n=1 Tax=Rotaria socialis TaxID=392032 RepID=A0A821TGI5_9BILA|nr:unnamed protein product [Rotaria socialis]CAF3483344.1 unnamed protein product [Rotaria socialis]CAF3535338.1 unnamed protein product [Rotaria socialis]CAF3560782.1 unnamed protein product [Rotaria socialis]CAF3726437.1 unnamed protein product [Rotaria socialis]
MAEHIDKICLNNNLRYRFDYVSKFLNFTKDDIACLNALVPIIFPRIPSLVEAVYKKFNSFDITKQSFYMRSGNFESFPFNEDTDATIISTKTDFRKDMLSMYLKRVFIQTEWNDKFLQYLSQIGEIHTESDRTESTHIDYMHVNTLLGYLENLLIDLLWNMENLDRPKKSLSIRAVNKFFWIQNDFFTMNYGSTVKK